MNDQSFIQKNKTLLIVLATVAVGIVITIGGQQSIASRDDDSQTCHSVVYTISASDAVDVTFQTQGGDTSQQDVASGDFRLSFCADVGAFVYVSGQVQAESGRVSCTVTSRGKVVSSNSSSGDYVIATCSGRA